MNEKSIYPTHYQGQTFRAGVAYLRSRSPTDDRAPRSVGQMTLDQQREIIAHAARAEQTIIVAEFIEHGDALRGLRPSLCALLDFTSTTHIPDCYVASRHCISRNRTEIAFWKQHFEIANLQRVNADEVRW